MRESTQQCLSSDYWWDWHSSSDWHGARMTSCCQWAILRFCSSQGKTKQTVTLSHANLLFSCDTAIYRLQLWIARLHACTHVHTQISLSKNSFDASFSLIAPITGGRRFASEWSHRHRGFLQVSRTISTSSNREYSDRMSDVGCSSCGSFLFGLPVFPIWLDDSLMTACTCFMSLPLGRCLLLNNRTLCLIEGNSCLCVVE